jgi:hypothetical protein
MYGPQHVDDVLAALPRLQQRHAGALRAIGEHRRRLESLGDDDGDDVALADAFHRLAPRVRLELLEVIDLAASQHLRQQRVDEVQVADEAHAGLAQHLARELARRAGLSGGPGKPEPLAAVVKQLLYAEPGHRATTR